MTENQLKEIKAIIEMTVKAVCKEMRGTQDNYCYKNTVKLLDNYQRLKNHVEYAISNSNDIRPLDEKVQNMELEFYSDYDEEFMKLKPDLFIDSILSSRVRSALMVAHIDAMITRLHDMCKSDGTKEYDKFLMFHDVYFNGMEREAVADKFHFSRSQAYRNINEMIEKLSVLLWGTNGLRWLL